MSGWFQGFQSLSSLREHASELANEILRESDPSDEVDMPNKVILLEKKIGELNSEIISLRESNSQLLNRAPQVDEKTEEHAHDWNLNVETLGGSACSSKPEVDHSTELSLKNYQFEVHKLTDEIKELKAECSHWKQTAKRFETSAQQNESELANVRQYFENELKKVRTESKTEQSELMASSHKKASEDDWDAWNVDSSDNGSDNQQAVVVVSADKRDACTNTQDDEPVEVTKSTSAEERLSLLVEELRRQLNERDLMVEQLKVENREMNQAYDDLNSEFEREKAENGLVVKNNRDLSNKLDSLKRDLVEYEERYEQCKADHEKTVQQVNALGTNFERMKNDLAESRHLEQKTAGEWQARIEKMTQELADSLSKRNEMANDVSKFESVVEDFQQKLKELSIDNRTLREENNRLKRELDEVADVKQILVDTDEELTTIRRNAKENELLRLKSELELRKQIESLQEEKDAMSRTQKEQSDPMRDVEDMNQQIENLNQILIDTKSRLQSEIDNLLEENARLKSRELLSCSSGEENDDTHVNNNTTVRLRHTNGADGSPYIQVDMVRGDGSPTATRSDDVLCQTDNFLPDTSNIACQAALSFMTENAECQTESTNDKSSVLQQSLSVDQSTEAGQTVEEKCTETIEAYANIEMYEHRIDSLQQSLIEKDVAISDLNEKLLLSNRKSDDIEKKSQRQSEIAIQDAKNELSTFMTQKQIELDHAKQIIDDLNSEKFVLQEKLVEVDQALQASSNELSELKSIVSDQKSIIDRLNLDSSSLMDEKRQLITLLNQKHEESIKYYNELQQWIKKQQETKTESTEKTLNSAVESSSQTDEPFFDLQQKTAIESELQMISHELKSKVDQINAYESSMADASQKMRCEYENMKQNMNLVIQSKDRATSELYAERQRSDKLVEQMRINEESANKNAREIERLRQHLVQIEEAYTAEVVKAEEREAALRQRLRQLEDESSNQSDYFKDGNQKLVDQLNELSYNLRLITDEKDTALSQLADCQLELDRSQKSLTKLQSVLVQFQQEKDAKARLEMDRHKKETELLRQQHREALDSLIRLEDELKSKCESSSLVSQMQDQINQHEAVIRDLRRQVAIDEENASILRNKIIELEKVRDGKIDKDVLRNLLLGYFCAPADKKPQVASLLGSVLDFSQDDLRKCQQTGSVSGPGSSTGWLNVLRSGSSPAEGSGSFASGEYISLTSQFVKFLESESALKQPATPLTTTLRKSSTSGGVAVGSRSQTPILSSASSLAGLQVELPRFSMATEPFSSSRASSSSSDFLRDVLKSGDNDATS